MSMINDVMQVVKTHADANGVNMLEASKLFSDLCEALEWYTDHTPEDLRLDYIGFDDYMENKKLVVK